MSCCPDFREIETHRPYLLRIACMRLHDSDAAEDAVQETLLAALQGAAKFEGRSALRTWLVGILRNKVVDAIRRRRGELGVIASLAGENQDPTDNLFGEGDHWTDHPSDANDGFRHVEQRQFLGIVDACLGKLPPRQARAFMMRSVFEMDSGEVCKALRISESNLWAMLFRARTSLRRCVRHNWLPHPLDT